MKKLGIGSIGEAIRKGRPRLFGHAERMEREG